MHWYAAGMGTLRRMPIVCHHARFMPKIQQKCPSTQAQMPMSLACFIKAVQCSTAEKQGVAASSEVRKQIQVQPQIMNPKPQTTWGTAEQQERGGRQRRAVQHPRVLVPTPLP